MNTRIYTAESVTSGHPDKLSDLIADSILDECLRQDENSRVACEVMLSHDKVFISGEITTKASVDYVEIAKNVIEKVGYKTQDLTFESHIHEQSCDIAQAVNKADGEVGAGDQGVMFGYATNETESYMPLCVELAHKLTNRLEQCRVAKVIRGLLPDGKSQVSAEYVDGKFNRITSIIVSAQHEETKSEQELQREIRQNVVNFVFDSYDLSATETLINPSGKFVIGGFEADTGLTGRKLMVDSYGGIARHGGGAFSGKDPSKVDRSGAYVARYIAKSVVASGLAEKCEVMLSYAIGKVEPTAVDVNTFDTGAVSEELIKKAVLKVFNLTPHGIIEKLQLKRPFYAYTAVGGHFGRNEFSWEKLDKVEELKNKESI